MSPMGGVGINLAIQDAVATANLLAEPLRRRSVSSADLERVQRRRMLPTRLTQGVQVFVQNQVIRRVLDGESIDVPWPARLLSRSKTLRRFAARAVGLGVRPESVHT
jgi:2-polyprenyl-6-methoxyphenol hydroxylase-like FAD-dependent oxidoreductase